MRSLASLVLLASLVACGDAGPGADTRRLVMTVAGDTGVRLAFARADGGGLRLVPSTAREEQPAWSPDGRTVAYLRRPGQAVGDPTTDVWLLDVASGRPRALVTTPLVDEGRPGWSPDGTRLVFERDGAVWTVPAAGGEPTFLVQGSQPTFTADGRVSFIRWPVTFPSAIRLMAVSLGGRQPTFVTPEDTAPGLEPLVDHAWSRAGRLAVIDRRSRYPNGTTRFSLLLLDPATGGRASVLSDSLAIMQPAWSPDDTQLVFARERPDGISLWSIAGTGAALRRLTPGPSNPASPPVAYAHPSWR